MRKTRFVPSFKRSLGKGVQCLAAALFLVVLLSSEGIPSPSAGVQEPGQAVRVVLIAPREKEVLPAVADIVRENLADVCGPSDGKVFFPVILESADAPTSPAEARHLFEKLDASKTLAVFSLCRDTSACYVASGAAETGIPTILFHSATVPMGPGETPSPFVFGLDADAGYRPEALAFWAQRRPEKEWVVLIDHLDATSRALGLATVRAMTDSGLGAFPVILADTSEERLRPAITEGLEGKKKVFISFLSPSRTMKAAGLIDSTKGAGTVVYGRRPSEILLKREGTIAFRQRMPFAEGAPQTKTGQPVDADLAAKAAAAAGWLAKALSSFGEGQPERGALAEALEKAGPIPMKSGTLRICEDFHIPAGKEIVVIESEKGAWQERKRLGFLLPERGHWVIR